ncbi:MAG: AAA family ATPase [Nanoarchaeota archaeon]|nr:AAA family ATPase [Nanoarchaeota archaeon]
MGKSFGIISLKGGVGKTSVTSSLGAAIADFDKRVLLVDGNFSTPHLGLHFNIIEPKFTLHEVLGKEANINQAIHRVENFDVIPSSVYPSEKINPFQLRDRIKFIKRSYDVVLIDSSPALGEETLSVMLASDSIIIVTTPDYPTLSTTLKAVKIAKQRGTHITGLVINKAYNRKFEISLLEIESFAEVPVLAVIPYDVNNLKALSKFTSSTNFKPKSKGSKEYRKLAATLIGEKYKPRSLKNLFGLTPKKQDINRELYYQKCFEE